ncbi:NADAR family protein [Actinoplanes sp. NPDC051470]|uniref:NADAR family protein n=1 Tax=Actinoplanes sp. NPDC051470 TaxID=3157224 RepID=UPI0034168FFA
MSRRTYRDVDGLRVEGIWRPVFIRNGGHYLLSDLVVYADGAIDTGSGLTDLDGLQAELRNGRVATSLDEGGLASAHHVGTWRFAEPRGWLDADMLVGEVADEIDRLNDRPDSTGRCLMAVETYLGDPTEANRLAVRDRYLAIPEHLRVYALGDMDRKDQPLKALIDGDERAVEYFRKRGRGTAEWTARVPADGPEQAERATLTLSRHYYPNGWPADPGIQVLQNDYAAVITVDGHTYPTVTHAYWALSTSDEETHNRIAVAPRVHDAAELAKEAPRRDNWPVARLAVMAALMRAKYVQHPALGETLLATGDARIIYSDHDSAYWVRGGTNWIGRLLEVIRSELAAEQAGFY